MHQGILPIKGLWKICDERRDIIFTLFVKHDDDECIPGGEGGNYIMYDKATSGDRLRNDRFSSCSIRQIMANVDAKRGRRLDLNAKVRPRLCLESYERMEERGDLCGNGVIDGDEECDCGHEEQCRSLEGNNSCCDWKKCKLNSGKICSPSQGTVKFTQL